MLISSTGIHKRSKLIDYLLRGKLGIGGRVDPGQPVDPLTRVDMSDPSLVKIDKFPAILTGWTGSTRPNLDPGTKM